MKLKNNLTLTKEEKETLIKMGQDLDNKDHIFNIYHYLAMTILYEIGFVEHDGTIRHSLVKNLAIFLEDKDINTLTNALKNKKEIMEFINIDFFGEKNQHLWIKWEEKTTFKDSKFLVIGGGSLYIGIESYDPKDFIYSDYLKVYIHKDIANEDYYFSELTQRRFGITEYDDEYKELKQKILGFSN